MHNMDRTSLEAEYERGYGANQDGGFDDEAEAEMFETRDDLDGEAEAEWGHETGSARVPGSPFDEAEEMEFAAELIEVASHADDAELEQFVGGLVRRAGRRLRKAGRRIRRAIKSRAGRAIVRGVRNVARRALPIVGGAFGGPAGAAAASSAGRVLGLELEGLSPEDQEFEVARRIVRLAGEATSMAAAVPESVDDDEAATTALRMAVRKHAPGLAREGSRSTSEGRQSGRWMRRGNTIVLMGV